MRAPILIVVIASIGIDTGCDRDRNERPEASGPPPVTEPVEPGSQPPMPTEDRFIGSTACQGCHSKASIEWRASDHSGAERELDPAIDRPAFEPSRTVGVGQSRAEVRWGESGPVIRAQGRDGEVRDHAVVRAFGHTPLRQYLLDVGGGRLQVSHASYDPAREEWFDVHADDVRQPGDWGHWSGGGMNWNARCAACHNVGLRVGYEPESDTYSTELAEHGVGCEACHGPGAVHAAYFRAEGEPGEADPMVNRWGDGGLWRVMETCATCHARRGPLTEDFVPGDRFEDHFALVLPDLTDIYYPDGQVHEENFVYAAFLGSPMHTQGVHCMDCHDSHTGALLQLGNALCLRCHEARPGYVEHGFHPPDSAGATCVGCHMPLTTYMQRDPRRDHGLTMPDPELTMSHGVPNACNRCHDEATAEWASDTMTEWYGTRDDRPRRLRSRVVAAARAGDVEAAEALLELARTDPSPAWRAAITGLLSAYLAAPGVVEGLVELVGDAEPLVRREAAQALSRVAARGVAPVDAALAGLLDDPVRSVRVAALRSLRPGFDLENPVVSELRAAITLHLDDPSGPAELASWLLERGDAAAAAEQLRRATSQFPNEAALHRQLAVVYAQQGDSEAALASMSRARELAPGDHDLLYLLSLAYSEARQVQAAIATLRELVALAPHHRRAWYNLGLLLRDTGRPDEALEALQRHEALAVDDVEGLFAQALILLDLDRRDEALALAQRMLVLAPGHPGAQRILDPQ